MDESGIKKIREKVIDVEFVDFEYTRADLEHPFIRDFYKKGELEKKRDGILEGHLPFFFSSSYVTHQANAFSLIYSAASSIFFFE